MIIGAMSDTHNQQFSRQIQPNYCLDHPEHNDIVVHAGDATVTGSMGEIHAFADWVRVVSRRLRAFLFVPGNHDWGFYAHTSIALEYFKDIKNFHFLVDSGVEFDGIKFWGTPVTKDYIPSNTTGILRRRGSDGWAYGNPESELEKHWKLIPNDTNVLITHSPPLGILDSNKMQSFGSPSLAARTKELEKQNLKYHIFGHIHESAGTHTSNEGKTIYVNAAMLNERYHCKVDGPRYLSI